MLPAEQQHTHALWKGKLRLGLLIRYVSLWPLAFGGFPFRVVFFAFSLWHWNLSIKPYTKSFPFGFLNFAPRPDAFPSGGL